MPKIEVPNLPQRVRIPGPAQISQPDATASQAFGGQSRIFESIAEIGANFVNEISRNQAASEISNAEMDIEREYYRTLNETITGQTADGQPIEPIQGQDRFEEFNRMASERISSIQHRGARNVMQSWYNKNVAQMQNNLLSAHRSLQYSHQIVEYAKYKEHKLDLPLDENLPLGKAITKRIAEMEAEVTTLAKVNPRFAQMAPGEIESIRSEVPMEAAFSIASNMTPEEGIKWLKKNRKELGLSASEYTKVQNMLESEWRGQEAARKIEEEEELRNILESQYKDIVAGNFDFVTQGIEVSDLPGTTKEDLAQAAQIGQHRERTAKLTGQEFPTNNFVYNELLDLENDLAHGNITEEEAISRLNYYHLSRELGTGSSAATKYNELRRMFREVPERAKADIKRDILDEVQRKIVWTGRTAEEMDRIAEKFARQGVLSKEEFEREHKRQWETYYRVVDAFRNSKQWQEADVADAERVGRALVDPFAARSYQTEIFTEAYNNYKRLWGIDHDAIVKDNYDYESAFRDNVVPTKDANGNFVWPEEYRIKKESDEPVKTKNEHTAQIVPDDLQKLEILKMFGGSPVIQIIDTLKEAGIPDNEILNEVLKQTPNVESAPTISPSDVQAARVQDNVFQTYPVPKNESEFKNTLNHIPEPEQRLLYFHTMIRRIPDEDFARQLYEKYKYEKYYK